MLVSGELKGQVLQHIYCAVGGDLGWATWVAVKCGPAAELQQGAPVPFSKQRQQRVVLPEASRTTWVALLAKDAGGTAWSRCSPAEDASCCLSSVLPLVRGLTQLHCSLSHIVQPDILSCALGSHQQELLCTQQAGLKPPKRDQPLTGLWKGISAQTSVSLILLIY